MHLVGFDRPRAEPAMCIARVCAAGPPARSPADPPIGPGRWTRRSSALFRRRPPHRPRFHTPIGWNPSEPRHPTMRASARLFPLRADRWRTGPASGRRWDPRQQQRLQRRPESQRQSIGNESVSKNLLHGASAPRAYLWRAYRGRAYRGRAYRGRAYRWRHSGSLPAGPERCRRA